MKQLAQQFPHDSDTFQILYHSTSLAIDNLILADGVVVGKVLELDRPNYR